MRAAGVRVAGGPVGILDLPDPRELRPDEVLIDVRACGVGNWDEIVRTGGWDVGRELHGLGYVELTGYAPYVPLDLGRAVATPGA